MDPGSGLIKLKTAIPCDSQKQGEALDSKRQRCSKFSRKIKTAGKMSQKNTSRKSRESGKSKKKQKVADPGNKLVLLFLALAVLITGVTLYDMFFQLPGIKIIPLPGDSAVKTTSSQNKPSKDPVKQNVNYSGGKSGIYQENIQKGFWGRVRKVDRALLQTLQSLDIDPGKLKHREIELRQHSDFFFYYQSLLLNLPKELQKGFISNFRNCLQRYFQNAGLERTESGEDSFRVKVDGIFTHLLKIESVASRLPRKGERRFQVAIVIDDMGENISKARKLINILEDSVSFSILPYSSYARQVANLALENNIAVLLHQPMEPLGYPEVDPGPGSLFVGMKSSRIKAQLAENLHNIPGVIGVNNHMGSKFTSSVREMKVVLRFLRERNLFFMDSLTSPESKVDNLASDIGVREVSRDIFLDNNQDVQAILFQLQKATELAEKNECVVAIGHPYPETLTALKEWKNNLGSQIDLCSIAETLKDK